MKTTINKKGFTIVELVIVIAVIAILAAVLIPTFTGVIKNANKVADEQEAAMFNRQLAIAGTVTSGAELVKALGDILGDETLAPRSASYGYHYWYDVKNNTVVLKSYEEIAELNDAQRSIAYSDAKTDSESEFTVVMLSMDNVFAVSDEEGSLGDVSDRVEVLSSDAVVARRIAFAESEQDSFRMFGNYYLLDNGGSVIGEALSALESGDDVADKVKALTEVKINSDNRVMADTLINKLSEVVIVGNGMTFVYNADTVTKFYFAPGIETVSSNIYYYYESEYIAKPENVVSITVPSTVTLVEEKALIFESTGEMKVMVQTAFGGAERIASVFQANSTSGIIVDISDNEYTISGATLMGADGSENQLAYGNPVVSFDIITPADTEFCKFVLDNMYIAYNHTEAIQLGAGNFVGVNEGAVSSEQVIWESDNEYVSVSADGKISVVGIPPAGNCIANITATAVAGNGEAVRTLTVNIVRPIDVEFTFASDTYDMTVDGDDFAEEIILTYKGDTVDFAFTDFYNNCNITGVVECDTSVTIIAGEGSLFEIRHNGTNYVLTLLKPTESENETQQFTVKIGSVLTKTFEVSVNDVSAEPFKVKDPFASASFLYRVGNKNAITLGIFFSNDKPAETTDLKITDVTLLAPIGTNANFKATVNNTASNNGAWSVSGDNWESTTIQFSGTGVAKIQLGEVSITVEVVDGLNALSYADFKSGNNIVMLGDIAISSGSKFAFMNTTLYGNDFTFDVSAGNYNADSDSVLTDNYVIYLFNGILDNVKIIGKVFDSFSITDDSADNICNVLVAGESKILNCYISYCSAPVRLKNGNLEIVNTTLLGGSVANLDIRGGHVILDTVTTINQKSVNGTPASEGAVGLGVIVWYEGITDASVTVKGTFTQYNCMSESDFKSIPLSLNGISLSNTIANAIFDANSGTSKFIYTDNSGIRWINTGIFSMTDAFSSDHINHVAFSNSNEYDGAAVSYSYMGKTYNGYLFSVKTEYVALVNPEDNYVSAGQGMIYPSFTVDIGDNAQDKVEGSNVYCYHDNGTVYISFDDGGSKTFYFDGLCQAVKGLNALTIANIYLDGVRVEENSIFFDASGNHVLTFEFDDPYNYDVSGNPVVRQHTTSLNISVSEAMPNAKNAEFTFGSSNLPSDSIIIDNVTHLSISKDYATGSSIGSITIDGNVIYYPIVEAYTSDGAYAHSSLNSWYMCFPVFKGAVTITDYADAGTGDAIVYNASTTTLPANLTVIGEKGDTYAGGPEKAFKYQSSSTAPADPANVDGVLCYKSPTLSNNARAELTYVVRYQYTDNVGATYYYHIGYHCPETTVSNSCVTPDTLVTLADGTQKEIQYVTYADKLLVWNFNKGGYDVIGASIVMNHGYAEYTVVTVNFADGTSVNTINGHGFFDVSENKFVILDEENVADYVGHDFVKTDGNGYTTTKLVGYSVSGAYTESWSILTAGYYNCILEGMWTLTPAEVEGSPDYLMPFEIKEMKYDEDAMKADIEKYGLYTYEEFADLITIEQFEALGLSTFKVAVGKGYITYEDILFLINLHC